MTDYFIIHNNNMTGPDIQTDGQAYDLTGLQQGTSYTFTITAYNCVGASTATTTQTFTTSMGCLAAPTMISASQGTAPYPYMTFQYSTSVAGQDGFIYYTREYNDPTSEVKFLIVPDLTGPHIRTATIQPGFDQREYAVTAYRVFNNKIVEESPRSGWVLGWSAQTPIPPTASYSPNLSPIGNVCFQSTMRLSWGALDNAWKWNVQVATDPGFGNIVHSVENISNRQSYPSGAISWYDDVSGLQTGQLYYWRVQPISGPGAQGDWLPQTSFTMIPLAITNPTTSITWTYGTQQTVQWAPACGSGDKVELFPNPTISVDHVVGTSTVLSTSASGGSLTFTVPCMLSTQARIQVTRTPAGGSPQYAYSVPITINLPSTNGNGVKVGSGVVSGVRSAPDGVGGSYVCWSDQSNGTDNDVFVAHLDGSGALTSGWPVNVTPNLTGNQLVPQLTGDGTGGVYVAWQDERGGASNADIYAIRLDQNAATVSGWGAAAPTYGGIPVCSFSTIQKNPNVALGTGNVLFVGWSDERSAQFHRIYAQKLSSSGSALWLSQGKQISQDGTDDDRPFLISDGVGGVYISYVNSIGHAYLQRLLPTTGNAGMGLLDSSIDEHASNSAENTPVLASDGGSGVIVAYVGIVGTNPPSGDIRAAHRDAVAYGAPWGGDYYGTVTVCGATGDQTCPAIAADGSGGAVVGWSDQRVSGTNALYALRIDLNGDRVASWAVNGVQVAPSIYLDGPGDRPAIVADGAGGGVLTWATPPGDISETVVSACGAVASPTVLCNDGTEQNQPCIVATAVGAAAVAWRDARCAGTNTGVFARSVTTPNLTAPPFGIGSGTFMQMVTWTGPPADPVYGAPVSFDIRTSSTAIDASSWDSAMSAGNVAANGPPGTPYCLPVTGLASCQTYFYAVRAVYANCSVFSVPFASSSAQTKCNGNIQLDCGSGLVYQSGTDAASSPTVLAFSQARPNPARDAASFDLAIPGGHEGEDVRFAIYDLLGRRVREVIHEPARVGRQTLQWQLDDESGAKVARGMYFARLQIGAQTFTHTVIVQR